jgi:hypothetical protein
LKPRDESWTNNPMKHKLEGESLAGLAQQLERIPALRQFVERRATGSPREAAWEVAVGLADIQESTAKLFQELVPALMRTSPNTVEAEELLHDVGEEYRHILYHISSTEYFRYILPILEDEASDDRLAP